MNTEKTRREAWVIKSNGKIRPRDRVIENGALKYHYLRQLMPGEIVVCWKYDDYGSAKKAVFIVWYCDREPTVSQIKRIREIEHPRLDFVESATGERPDGWNL